MLEISIAQLGVLQLLVLIVSTAAGVVSFGFAMIMTPFLLIFVEPRLVVEINVVLTTVLFAVVATHSWRHINVGTLLALLLGGAVGIPFGVLFTKSVEETALSLTLTGVVIATALWAMFGKSWYFSRERLTAAPIGCLFTFLSAGLALGGPVVVLFALNQRWDRDQTRATLSSFFLVTGIVIVASHSFAGLMGVEELRSAALFVPALIAGSLISSRLVGRINEGLFRKLVLVVLMGASFGVLGRELAKMF